MCKNTNADENLWGVVDPECWKEVSVTYGRPATEADVRDGRAVFFVDSDAGPSSVPFEMVLPARAVLHDSDQGLVIPVVVIQAETLGNNVAVGYRPLSGGNGVCTLPEVDLVDTDSEWLNELA